MVFQEAFINDILVLYNRGHTEMSEKASRGIFQVVKKNWDGVANRSLLAGSVKVVSVGVGEGDYE